MTQFGKKEMRILMVGLDAAGKTTILYKLKLGEGECGQSFLGVTLYGLLVCFTAVFLQTVRRSEQDLPNFFFCFQL